MLADKVTTSRPLALIICPGGIESALDWLDDRDIGFGLDHRYIVFLTDAYEAWKALNERRPGPDDVVIQACPDLLPYEEVEYRDLVRYLRVRGWWVI